MSKAEALFTAARAYKRELTGEALAGLSQADVDAINAATRDRWQKAPVVAQDAFARALPLILVHEGGYVNHPKDPGGATNKGVTQATYDGWRARKGLPSQSVRSITDDEIAAIYRRDYWDKVKGDDLPAGVAYAVFDFAVNSGVDRASRYLQKVIGAAQDGEIGPATVAAAKARSQATIIDMLCDERMAYLRSLKTFSTFGKGWTRRVAEVREKAKELAR